MLKIEVDNKSVSVKFDGSLPELLASLTVAVREIRANMDEDDREFFDFCMNNLFAASVTLDASDIDPESAATDAALEFIKRMIERS